MGKLARIYVVPLALNKQLPLLEFCADLERIFHLPVEPLHLNIPINNALDLSRRQYNSSTLLKMLLDNTPDSHSKILGVTSYDLFLPVLTFLFGQAQVNKQVSIFSTFRLHNEFYGMTPSTELLYTRSLKEAMHELGHTYGLRHCLNPGCVMNAATYVEDIDVKESYFCSGCEELVKSNINTAKAVFPDENDTQ
jgi:archaemetzincin